MFATAFQSAIDLRNARAAGRAAALALAAVPFLAGCGRGVGGPERAAVSGVVRLDEVPLRAGIIRFVPQGATKGPVALATIKDGKFGIPAALGPTVGKNAIEIVAVPADNPLAGATDIKTAWAQYARSARTRLPEVIIPKRYNRNSTLIVDVTSKAKNAFDFKLASQ
jgi:hypothetical protein